MSAEIKIPKKLIEVSIPLDVINEAAIEEKSNPFLRGHPRSLHQWWARRPLPCARATIFCQMVNDPGYERNIGRGVNKEKANEERKRLFAIVEKLVKWENNSNEEVLNEAYLEIVNSWRETCLLNKDHPEASKLFNSEMLPSFHDFFAGGGAIPLEAQKLGLNTSASDLNPVAVVINKAMIELPGKFKNCPPVGPKANYTMLNDLSSWKGVTGLAEDVRRYSCWIQQKAEERLRQYYPAYKICSEVTAEREDLLPYLGQEIKIVGWIWARTVKSPNPAYSHIDVPLISTYVLSNKKNMEVYLEPYINSRGYEFKIKKGNISDEIKKGTTAGKRAGFICLMSGSPIGYDYIRAQGKAGNMSMKLIALVGEGTRGRIYLPPKEDEIKIAQSAFPDWIPRVEIPKNSRDFKTPNYGLSNFSDLFTLRQLHTLNTFSDLILESIKDCQRNALERGFLNDNIKLDDGGTGASAYGEAVGVYLALILDKLADYSNTICTWNSTNQNVGHLFTKQAIPMAWDFVEASPLDGGLSFESMSSSVVRSIEMLGIGYPGNVYRIDAATSDSNKFNNTVISIDPPYFDNISYADLAEFFNIWMKRTLSNVFPSVFKDESNKSTAELVACSFRHGSKDAAKNFFMNGMKNALFNINKKSHPAFPVTIFYAFKQSEDKGENEGIVTSGWETFLDAVIGSGFCITGTWPMRTERATRAIGQGANALASSIVLVCRKRTEINCQISRREFLRELNKTLPEAISDMTSSQSENYAVAPVDLSQAIIGPGMAIFSKYSAVIEADGQPMSVKKALQLINRFLTEDDFDLDTQFCLHWFENYIWGEESFGEADVLARAKGTSVEGLKDGGVANSSAGKFSLIKWQDLDEDWSPETDNRTSHWEMLHHLIRAYNNNGESSAGEILARIHSKSETIRALAYRLYTVCERKKYADDAASYNNLILAWEAIEMAAQSVGVKDTQISLFDDEPDTKVTTKKTKRKK